VHHLAAADHRDDRVVVGPIADVLERRDAEHYRVGAVTGR
jgi:hypothetical protein